MGGPNLEGFCKRFAVRRNDVGAQGKSGNTFVHLTQAKVRKIKKTSASTFRACAIARPPDAPIGLFLRLRSRSVTFAFKHKAWFQEAFECTKVKYLQSLSQLYGTRCVDSIPIEVEHLQRTIALKDNGQNTS